MGVSVQKSGAMVTLDWVGGQRVRTPLTGDRYLLTGRLLLDQTGHNVSEVREGRMLWILVLVPWSENMYRLVCRTSHIYVHYTGNVKKKLAELLHLEEAAIPA